MTRLFLTVFLSATFILTACSRGDFSYGEPEDAFETEEIFLATQHKLTKGLDLFGNERDENLSFYVGDISIPPNHKTGQIEWAKGKPDTEKFFTVVNGDRIETVNEFVDELGARPSFTNTIVIFVHGFNTNIAEATYRIAQIKHDFDIEAPMVAYAWPSAGAYRGYLYDRDSVLFSRDGLEELIRTIHQRTNRKVFLVGHSMGSYLIMETLRQMSIKSNADMRAHVSEVALLAPDIDQDVFERQVGRIERLPNGFSVFVTATDKALLLSGFLTGRQNRVGSNVEPSPFLIERGITFVDVTEFDDDAQSDHSVAFTSPSAIASLLQLIERRNRTIALR